MGLFWLSKRHRSIRRLADRVLRVVTATNSTLEQHVHERGEAGHGNGADEEGQKAQDDDHGDHPPEFLFPEEREQRPENAEAPTEFFSDARAFRRRFGSFHEVNPTPRAPPLSTLTPASGWDKAHA